MFMASRPTVFGRHGRGERGALLGALEPALPAVPQAMVLPRMSVMVMSRLLKVAEMCAMPSDSTSFFERLTGNLAGAAGAAGCRRAFREWS